MKFRLIFFIPLFFVSLSGRAETPTLQSCAKIENPVERLTCYDKLSGRLSADMLKTKDTTSNESDSVASKADLSVPEVPAVAPIEPVVEPLIDAEADFGLEHKHKQELPDELQLRWTKKMQDAHGKWIIYMENGQVWRQTEGASFSFNDPEQRVVISRGVLGSFFLKEPDGVKRIRVMRIK